MTRLKYIGIAIVLLCFGLTSAAQNISNKGKEFWVAYGHHQYMEGGGPINSQDMTLYLSTEDQAATVTVTIDSSSALPTVPSTWWRRTYNIPPYTVINITTTNANVYTVSADKIGAIPKTGSQDARLFSDPPPAGNGGEGHWRKKGIHIESNVPIVAYAHIYADVSSGATMLLPVDSWGFSYTTINSEQIDAGGPAYSWVYVIAKENNTVVRITPSETTRLGKPAGVPFDVTLQKGQVYQIIGQSDGSGNGKQFTGTTVKSIAGPDGTCKQIAVFAGSSRTRGESDPCGSGSGRDNDMQQCYPEHAWGKRYLTAPFSTSGTSSLNPSVLQTSVYKIVMLDPNTVVKRNGVVLTNPVNPGNYYKFSSNTADFIEADKPIMIAQFMSGSSTCNPGGAGDPEMVYLSPIEQAIKSVGFYRNTETNIYTNFVTLVIPTPGVASLKIDGVLFNNHPAGSIYSYPHPQNTLIGKNYTVVVKGWLAAQAQTLISSDSAFNIITYGLGGAESYAYSGGAYINNLNYASGIQNIPLPNSPPITATYAGVSTPFKLGLLLRYIPTKMLWKFSQKSPNNTLNSIPDGNAPDVNITQDFWMDPAANFFVDSPVINSIKYYRYILPDSFIVNTAGQINIPIDVYSPGITNCGNREQLILNLEVRNLPNIGFTASHTTKCTKDSIYITGPVNATQAAFTYPLIYRYWTIKKGPDTVLQGNFKDTTIVLPPGTYVIKVQAITETGLLTNPSSQTITVYNVPTAVFDANPDTLCLNQPITFSQTSSYGGPSPINYYSWDLDDGSPGTSSSWSNPVKNYPAFGTYNTYLVVGVSPKCISDTARKVVVVNDQAHATIAIDPPGCLPASGIANFTASATAQGGTAITSYSWDFGDPTTGSNNTSTQQNPSHAFSTPGTYMVVLSIETATGCTGKDTLYVNANIKASLNYPALAPVCQNLTNVSVATATVTNGIAGTGYYYDASGATTNAGIFNPSIAGAGNHTIWYVYTTNTNCKDSISQTISVSPRPAKPAVTTPVNYCQGEASPASLSATALPGHTLTWYSDPSLTTVIPGTPTPSTVTPGTTKYYVTQTSSGCESEADTITVTITEAITSKNISASQTICEGSPVTDLVSDAPPAGGTGTYTYQWQISTDGSGAIWINIFGVTGETYNPGNLTATTRYRRIIISGLCSGTSNEVIITVVPQITNYQVTPATQDVCVGLQPANLDGQTPPGAGPFTYSWEQSTGSGWTVIAGETGEDYLPPSTLTVTTQFRRKVVNGPCEKISDPVTVVIKPNADGNITAPASICSNDPAGVSITFNATAGTAPYNISYTITGPSGVPTTVTQNGIASGATFNVIPAGSAAGTYNVVLNSITNSNTCVKSTGFTPITINVTAIPVVTVSVSPSATVCEGTPVTFTASGATTYDWGGGNTNASYTVTPAPGNPGYQVTGTTNGCNGTGSGSVTVNPRPAKPTVTSPVNYCQGDAATALAATGDPGNTITWYTNPGLTGGSTTPPVPSTATAGTTIYYVTQTNSGGCESDDEVINVNITPSIASNDFTPAAPQNICSGSAPVLTMSAPTGGTGTYTYQWQSSTDGGTVWNDIAGETNPGYTAPDLTASIRYRRVVYSGLCSNTSAEMIVNVTPALDNNSISASHNVCETILPDQLTGTTPTGGDGTYSYQWQSSPDGSTWTDITTNGTNATYDPPVLTATTYYRRKVTSGPCSDNSAAIIVTVIPNANGSIAAEDADICQYDAGNIIFNATAGTAPFTIDYTITAPGGATTASNVSVSSGAVINVIPTGSAAGTYTITLNSITNSNNCVRTGLNSVTITVTQTPVVALAPISPVCVGGTVPLAASGAAGYTWISHTTGGTLSSITGANVSTTPSADGTYNFSVVGATNSCNSDTVHFSVVINPRPAAPTVTTPVEYCQLGAASALTGSGDAGNTITWYDNAGLTGGVTTAPTPSTNSAGTFAYYVTQTNSFSCESTPATITINVAPGVGGNNIGPDAQTICQGNQPASLTNAGTLTGGNGTYSYQWQVSTDGGNTWNNIPGATGIDYSPDELYDTTWYRRNVTSSLCGSISDTIVVNVFEGLGNYQLNGTYPETICAGTAPLPIDGQSPTGTGPYTFTWEQSTDNINWTVIPSLNTEDYDNPPVLNDTIWYRRKVSNGPCTAVSDAVRIDVNPVADGNITAPAAICIYQSAAITFHAAVGTGTFIIQYNITAPGGTITSSGPVSVTDETELNVIPTGSAAGVYTIMLTSIQGSNGCIRTAGLNSVSINVNPRPVVTIDPVTAMCEGDAPKIITAHNASSYEWNPGGLTGNSISVTPAITTEYTVIGKELGCESLPVSVVLTVNPKPNASFTIGNDEICLYETASFTNNSTIDSGSITALYWDFDNGNLDTTGYTTSALSQSYAIHRVYNVKLKAVSDKGCVSDQFILPLTVNSVPVASFNPPAFVCMPNGVATFQNTSTNANGSPMGYTWTFGDAASGGANTSSDVNGSHVYPDSASYDIKLLAVSAQGCRDSVTVPFNTFFNKPVAKFGVTPDTLCQGIQNAFFDSSFAPGSNIDTRLWTFGDGSTSTAAAPVKTYLHPGNYQVNLKVSNTQGCTADVNKNIVVYLQPVIEAGPTFVVPVGTTVTFNAQANSPNLAFAWTSLTYGVVSNPSILRPSYIADQDGIFILTATGEGNCSATDTMAVKVLRPISIPNAFSPNGDGINDTWNIHNLGDYPMSVVEVFNRYGQPVYKQYGYSTQWNGKMNGQDLPVGTYYYIIDPKNGFPRVTGYVVIVR